MASLSENISKTIDKFIFKYIEQISHKYELNSDELILEWKNFDTGNTNSSSNTKKNTSSSVQDYSKLTKKQIQEICRDRGLKCSGTKPELIDVLNSGGSSSGVSKTKNTSVSKTETKTPVAKKLTSNIENIVIRRNEFNNFVHPETSLVFDKKKEKVIGKQNNDGSIDDLEPQDINICNQYMFGYILPENLDNKNTLDDEKVEELEEEIDSDIEVEEAEEIDSEEELEEEIEEEEEEEIEED